MRHDVCEVDCRRVRVVVGESFTAELEDVDAVLGNLVFLFPCEVSAVKINIDAFPFSAFKVEYFSNK